MIRPSHAVFLLLAACNGDKEEDTDTDSLPADDADSDTDADSDSDADADSDTDGDADTDTGTPPEPAVRDPKFDDVIAVLLSELDVNLASGLSIAVMEQGTITWAEGFGTADPAGAVPIGPDMAFQIGSTTKQMTAALVLQQVEGGTLDLRAPLSEVLPNFSLAADPTWAPSATLHELISHQGGLVDTLDWFGTSDDEELARWYAEVYGPFYYPMSPPGAFWNYANPNFSLAGLAAETHDPAGRFYSDLLIDDLFTPLGMDHTFIRKDDVLAYGDYALSTGYGDLTSYTFVDVPMEDIGDAASIRPAGLVWSTPTDMCTWGQFVMHGNPAVLDDTLRTEITTPHVSTLYYEDHYSYGYGEFLWDLYPMSDGWYPIRVWEHGGNTLTFTSVFYMLPDQDVVISILSNGYGDLYPETTEAVIRAVVDPLPAVSAYPGPVVDPTDLEGHLGTYLENHVIGNLIVTSDGAGGLLIDLPALTDYGIAYDPVLIPVSTDLWYLDIEGAYYDLTFIRDRGAESPYVRNRAFVGTREVVPVRQSAPPSREAVLHWLETARVPAPIALPR